MVSISHHVLPLLPMFSQEQSERFSQAPRPSNDPVFYPSNPYRFSYRRTLFPLPSSSLHFSPSLSLSARPQVPFPHLHTPLSRALHSTTSCHTLIHPPRVLTKHSLPVSLSHQALATATLLLLSTPPPLPVTPSSIRLVSY